MGTHPIFESDFDCLTESREPSIIRGKMSEPTIISLLKDILNEFYSQKESMCHLEVTTDRCINGIETNQIGITELFSTINPANESNFSQQLASKDKRIKELVDKLQKKNREKSFLEKKRKARMNLIVKEQNKKIKALTESNIEIESK